MSDFKPIDDPMQANPSINLRSSDSSEGNKPILIPLNANANVGNNPTFSGDERQLRTGKKGSDSNGNPNPEEHGATSMKKRSKRPTAKPSPALLLAKQNALLKKRAPQPQVEVQIMMKDHLQPARDAKDNIRRSTGVVYDLSMLQHRCLWDPNYPEKPERMSSVIYRCEELGLLARAKHLEPRIATQEEVLLIHPPEHIEKLQKICEGPDNAVENLERHASNYDAVYFHPSTYNLSLLAAGSTVNLVDAVLGGQIQNGMAIIRPPGHHAMKSEYCGYCFFNNVAIAAKKALDSGKASKILIVDFDVHHGQATQQAFYNDPRVLYFSTHRFEHGLFWPNLKESNFNYIGSSDGIGYNCNVPLNRTGMGNSDFLTIWHQLLLPLAYQFNPDLVIVSAGYDAALGCFEGEMEVTPACYSHLISPLMGLAGGKVAVVLEGGYCLKSLAEGAALTLKTLLGDSCPLISAISRPVDEAVETVLNATYMLKSKWSLLIGQTHVDEGEETRKSKNIHRPVAKYLWTEPKPKVYETRNCYPEQSTELMNALDTRLNQLILTTDLRQPPHRVSIVYDDLMLKHRNAAEPGHPERPERISNIFACHGDFGLLERCHRLKSREAKEEELLLIHTEDHIRKMKGTQTMSNRDLHRFKEHFNSIYFNNNSYQCALVSAGSILQVVDSVLDGQSRAGVAIVRPPGHHAEIDEPCGFCLFNNVALAAKYAIQNHDLKRILILDWDVHHGNGIQHVFEDDSRVLYISLHRYDNGSFFPCSDDANYDKVGRGPGTGYNVNIPWNRKGMGDTEYLAAFLNVVMPIAYEYNPEMVFVSAGFDAAKGDPLGGCKVTPEGYAHMTHLLSSLANGRMVVALEGGYNLTAIAYSMTLCTKALLGDPIPPLQLKDEVDPVAVESIRNVLDTHAEYWSVIKPFRKQFPFNTNLVPVGKYIESGVDEKSLLNSLQKLKLDYLNDSDLSFQEDSNSSSTLLVDSNSNPVIGNIGNMDSANNQDSNGAAAPGPSASKEKPEPFSITVELVPGADAVGNTDGGLTDALRLMQEGLSEGNIPGVVVQPRTNCPHLDNIGPVPDGGIDVQSCCTDCQNKGENWICLKCYSVFCSRYVNGHMVQHGETSGHKIALSFADLSVWCYGCDDYIEHAACKPAKSAAHLSKFGKPI